VRYASCLLLLLAPIACDRIAPPAEEPSPGLYAAFDALSASEITTAVRVARAQALVSAGARVVTVSLDEPDKSAVLAGRLPRRIALVITYDADADHTVETRVQLPEGQLERAAVIPGVQPMIGDEDGQRATRIVNADPRWIAALRRRGIEDPSTVAAVAWSAGYFGDSTQRGRLVHVVPTLRERATDAVFLRPIEGVSAMVNLTSGTITSLIDAPEVVPVSAERALPTGIVADASSDAGAESADLEIEGGLVRWKRWRLHVAADRREGVVLHRVSYMDGARERSLLYRAAVSEMVVPYGDPDAAWYVRNALDAGELGLGQFALPLRAGVDVPRGARFLPATLADANGVPVQHDRAIAVYERDGGLAWRYQASAYRARQLVVEWISTVGNYEYGFAWIFHEDGTIEQRTTLTGIMSVKGMVRFGSDSVNGATPHGQRLTDRLVAPHHQHFFAFRLDPDIDGADAHVVHEIEGQPSSIGDVHASHAGITAGTTRLATEHEARRVASGATARRWLVQNSSQRNAIGDAVGLSLLPGETALPLADRSAWIRRRAGFMNAQLWVTPYRRGELYAAGDYPNQSRGGDGLPHFTRTNAPVADVDVVLWYVMGITHLPRTEDWPVMPSHVAGFKLVPTGLFDRNPLIEGRNTPE
jgi:primary-amine oxidase